MKKQPVVRTLLRQLAARVELDRSLGALFAPCRLPDALDLSRSPEPKRTPADTLPRGVDAVPPTTIPSMPMSPTAPVSRVQPSAEKAGRPSSADVDDGAAHVVPSGGAELSRAVGTHLPAFVPAPAGGMTAEAVAATLAPIREEALVCRKCRLCDGRRHVVFGEGDLATDLVFVGEAPGRDEDLQGRPFVGRAGQLLTAMIEKGMRRPRESVYICNMLKCRPPRNRDPLPDEVSLCSPYLHAQLEAIRPRLIIALGRVAAMALTGEQLSMRRLRGNFYRFRGIPLMPTYHPSYLLRQRAHENDRTETDRETWEDLKKAMAFLAQSTPGSTT